MTRIEFIIHCYINSRNNKCTYISDETKLVLLSPLCHLTSEPNVSAILQGAGIQISHQRKVITTLNRDSPDDKVIEKLRSLELLSKINYIILKLAHTFSQVYFCIIFVQIGRVGEAGQR